MTLGETALLGVVIVFIGFFTGRWQAAKGRVRQEIWEMKNKQLEDDICKTETEISALRREIASNKTDILSAICDVKRSVDHHIDQTKALGERVSRLEGAYNGRQHTA